MEESQPETSAKDFSVEKKLLDWCKERLSGWVLSEFTTASNLEETINEDDTGMIETCLVK